MFGHLGRMPPRKHCIARTRDLPDRSLRCHQTPHARISPPFRIAFRFGEIRARFRCLESVHVRTADLARTVADLAVGERALEPVRHGLALAQRHLGALRLRQTTRASWGLLGTPLLGDSMQVAPLSTVCWQRDVAREALPVAQKRPARQFGPNCSARL